MSVLLKKRKWRMYIMFAMSGGMFAFLFLGLTWLASLRLGYQPSETTLGTSFLGSFIVGIFTCSITEVLIIRRKKHEANMPH